jgi:hypothetical protein
MGFMLDVSCLAEDQSDDTPRLPTEDKRPDARIRGMGDLLKLD